jgi:hypothetical protein
MKGESHLFFDGRTSSQFESIKLESLPLALVQSQAQSSRICTTSITNGVIIMLLIMSMLW